MISFNMVGIYYYPKHYPRPWRACYYSKGKNHYLGQFATLEAAQQARREADEGFNLAGETKVQKIPRCRVETSLDYEGKD